ncbi:MAG: N-acetyl-alpha-D-glucosaminyl L-malate synthase BshA [Cryomorphaceae bacterium]|nr:N-acetyl-alpha-D-glucosaminyl L-malate synthase BshA [Cryomorphaceae bacterium]
MKIGIVCYPTFGGSGVIATELGKYLALKGHQAHFITYDQPVRLNGMVENTYYHEVSMHDYPLFQYQPYELALSSKMVQVIRKWKLDVLHVHYAIPHAYAAHMAKLILKADGINIPVITTLHGTDITLVGKNPIYRDAVNFSINASDVVTSVSKSLKEDTERLFSINRPIEVIPNFIDKTVYLETKPCLRKQFAPDGERIISHISNFRPVKRLLDIVRVFAQVCKDHRVKLLMVGDGPDKEKARDLAIELGVADHVIFTGKVLDIDRVLRCSDLFMLPSEKESFGLAALEAMACSVPVVSSNTGGLPEVNIHGETGFTAAVGDVDVMAHYIKQIFSNQQLEEKLRLGAKAQADRFDIQFIAPLYEAVYQKAVSS